MTDLARASEVTAGNEGWTATLHDDWQIWGPVGGYQAVIALRAAGLHTGPMRPVSLECHFLRTPHAGEVTLSTTTLRSTPRAHSVRVSMMQEGRPVLEAMVWSTAVGLDGLPSRTTSAPSSPRPQELASAEELLPDGPWLGDFCRLIEERPLHPEDYSDWPKQQWSDPLLRAWLRFRPQATFSDPLVDAGRSLIAIDIFPFIAAACVLSKGEDTHRAPTISLSVSFHKLVPESEWLLLHAESPAAGDGLVGGQGRVWAGNGDLIATGRVQMLCRT
jgi:acyl-CoA thioesterase